MVRKKDDNWWPCGHFHGLNLAMKDDKYPVPNLSDCMAHLEGCTVFSKLDLRNGYLQVPLNSATVPKTAVITPWNAIWLEKCRHVFSAPNGQVMCSLDFIVTYIDNIIVASPDFATHLQHPKEVFLREFARSFIEFLGHSLSTAGCSPLPSKVIAIRKHPHPHAVKELQQFLGMTNFYRKFLPSAAKPLSPLTNALCGSPPGSSQLSWFSAWTQLSPPRRKPSPTPRF